MEGSRAKLKSLPDLDRLLSRVHSNGLRREKEPVLFEASTYSARQIRDFADTLSGLETVAQMIEAFQSASVRSPLLQRVLYALPREKDRIPQEVKAQTQTQTKTEKDRAGQFPFHSLRALLSHFRGIFDEKQARKEGTITPRPGVSEEYDAAMEALQEILSSFTQHLEEMKRTCGVHDLKYFGNGKDRYQIEVPVAYINKLPSNWVSKSTKKTHRRYWTPFLERQVQRLIHAEEAVKACQKDTLRCLFAKFDEFRDVFERVSQCVAVYDALLALSEVSSQPQYCWPQFVHREQSHADSERAVAQLKIVGGRHPTVEQLLQERGDGDFIPNDVLLGGTTTLSVAEREKEFIPRMLLLTGPNMGGKSTLLRQTCLLVILAQLGCKVPAEECVLSPVDRIFTRVGASDRILAGQSTFFVELAETSLILRHATEDSLCILDELGRGTATFDGTAIAHSVVEYLVSRVRCRSLFATHYHLLVQDWEIDPRVRLGHMDCFVQESENDAAGEKEEDVTFLYKLCDGASPKSYGINVARLAGLPASLIRLASHQSQRFEEKTNRKRFRHSQGLQQEGGEQQEEGQDEGERAALVYSQAHKVFTVFERLVSIAHAELSLEELAFVAREIWRRCETMGL